MKPDEHTCRQIVWVYENTNHTLIEICEGFDVTQHQVYRLVEEYGSIRNKRGCSEHDRITGDWQWKEK